MRSFRNTCGLFLSVLAAGCFNTIYMPFSLEAHGKYEEHVVRPARRFFVASKIAVIDISGLITTTPVDAGFRRIDGTANQIAEKLRRAEDDPLVRGVILRINSPGGGVTASDIVHSEIKAFQERSGKPVVGLMLDIATSGGVYVAMPCRKVVAHPSTVTGSIGVIMQMFNVKGLMEWIRIEPNVIKSGEMKDIGSPFRDMSDEERAVMTAMVESFYAQFVDVVAKGRNMKPDAVRKFADGRVFTAATAAEYGLIDKVGYFDDALEMLKELAGISDAHVVIYRRPGGYAGSVYAGGAPDPARVSLITVENLRAEETPLFMYLYRPGVF